MKECPYFFLFFETEGERAQVHITVRGGAEDGGESQADSVLISTEPNVGRHLITMRS